MGDNRGSDMCMGGCPNAWDPVSPSVCEFAAAFGQRRFIGL